jgi:hypothetical protein
MLPAALYAGTPTTMVGESGDRAQLSGIATTS